MSAHPKVFISHSHMDRHTAVELQAVLESQGAETFLDQDRIQAADILPERIRDGIGWADVILLLWSSRAAASDWVRREWDAAYDLRKKIIPYCLDAAPMPPALENLVYVAADDREHGDANLLRAVFGEVFSPSPETLFPGRWHAAVDAFGSAQGTYDFELRPNGQLEGAGAISGSGIAGEIAGQLGMSGLLTMKIPIYGSWSYDRGSKLLTIQMSTGVVFGQQNSETITIRTTGQERGAISGSDLAGRTWTLRRVEEGARSPLEDEKQRVRKALQQIVESADSRTKAVVLAATCLGAQEKSQRNLGLPTKKARRVLQAQSAGDFQRALEEFVQALERGGWIH